MVLKNSVLNKGPKRDRRHAKCRPSRSRHSFPFFGEKQKSIKKGENHYKSGHVESFTYSQGILGGEVHASMRNKVYKVTVSGNGFRILTADAACRLSLFVALKCFFSVRFLN